LLRDVARASSGSHRGLESLVVVSVFEGGNDGAGVRAWWTRANAPRPPP
jgi:hypothetical protein